MDGLLIALGGVLAKIYKEHRGKPEKSERDLKTAPAQSTSTQPRTTSNLVLSPSSASSADWVPPAQRAVAARAQGRFAPKRSRDQASLESFKFKRQA